MSKPGRNDPCPCGSGKKYKNCHMLQEKESAAAKYTASGKRKFKAKIISTQGISQSVFSRSATTPTAPTEPAPLQRLRFRKTKKDYRTGQEAGATEGEVKPLPFPLPTSELTSEPTLETPPETPHERERHLPLPGESFKPTSDDFRKKQ